MAGNYRQFLRNLATYTKQGMDIAGDVAGLVDGDADSRANLVSLAQKSIDWLITTAVPAFVAWLKQYEGEAAAMLVDNVAVNLRKQRFFGAGPH